MPEKIESYFRDRKALLSFRTAFLTEDVAGMEALLSEVTPEGLPDLQMLVERQKASMFTKSISHLPHKEQFAKIIWALVQEYNRSSGGRELNFEELPYFMLKQVSGRFKILEEESSDLYEAATKVVERTERYLDLNHQLHRVGTEDARNSLRKFYDANVAPLVAAHHANPWERAKGVAPPPIMDPRIPSLQVSLVQDVPKGSLDGICALAEQKGYHVFTKQYPDQKYFDLFLRADFK